MRSRRKIDDKEKEDREIRARRERDESWHESIRRKRGESEVRWKRTRGREEVLRTNFHSSKVIFMHTNIYTEIKRKMKLMRWSNTHTHEYWRDAHLPMVYPRFRSLHRGPLNWELVVLFSCTSDGVVLATGGEDLFKDRLGMSRAGKLWEPISTDWDFFFSLRGNSTEDMKNWYFKPLQAVFEHLSPIHTDKRRQSPDYSTSQTFQFRNRRKQADPTNPTECVTVCRCCVNWPLWTIGERVWLQMFLCC